MIELFLGWIAVFIVYLTVFHLFFQDVALQKFQIRAYIFNGSLLLGGPRNAIACAWPMFWLMFFCSMFQSIYIYFFSFLHRLRIWQMLQMGKPWMWKSPVCVLFLGILVLFRHTWDPIYISVALWDYRNWHGSSVS